MALDCVERDLEVMVSGPGRIRQLIGTNGKTFLSRPRLDQGCSAGNDDYKLAEPFKQVHTFIYIITKLYALQIKFKGTV